jgi:ubiquinone/menaquinone biosynthesis C-methylase UbiE
MALSALDWHRRFSQQARWTNNLRNHLFERAGVYQSQRVLSVGCGTGAVLQSLLAETRPYGRPQLYGIDLNPQFLFLAKEFAAEGYLTCGDGYRLPFPQNFFDSSFCHYLLLWVSDPVQILTEMARVTRPNSAVLALAEPDYGGRVDFPEEFAQLGIWQTSALQRQGADPYVGRRLARIFTQAGLVQVEYGVLGGEWTGKPPEDQWESEWEVLRSDLEEVVSRQKLDRLHASDAEAWRRGERVLFVPTFYAWGRVSQ